MKLVHSSDATYSLIVNRNSFFFFFTLNFDRYLFMPSKSKSFSQLLSEYMMKISDVVYIILMNSMKGVIEMIMREESDSLRWLACLFFLRWQISRNANTDSILRNNIFFGFHAEKGASVQIERRNTTKHDVSRNPVMYFNK